MEGNLRGQLFAEDVLDMQSVKLQEKGIQSFVASTVYRMKGARHLEIDCEDVSRWIS